MLGGELGEKYGTEHEYYNLRSPAEAIKLLCVNYPALQKDLTEAHQNGVGYKVIQGGAAMGYDELALPFGSKPLMVVPVISGAFGDNTGRILLGVGLVAAAIVFAPAAGGFLGAGLGIGATTTTTFSLAAGAYVASTSAALVGGLSTAIGAIGASLVLGGVANLISPQPEIPKLGKNRLDGGTNVRGTGPQGITRGASGQQSYAFSGPANTVGTGATVPVIYGRVITGGHLLSVDIDISDESDPLRKTLGRFSRKHVTINGERINNSLRSLGDLPTRRLDSKLVFANDKDRRINIGTVFGPSLIQLIDEESSTLKASNDNLVYKYEVQGQLRKKVDVIFEISTNFFDYVGDETTTKIDAFVIYSIKFKLTGVGQPVVASASATLQGKFHATSSDPFVYGHRFKLPKVKDADDIKVEVEITDASVRDPFTFKLVGYGYDLL